MVSGAHEKHTHFTFIGNDKINQAIWASGIGCCVVAIFYSVYVFFACVSYRSFIRHS